MLLAYSGFILGGLAAQAAAGLLPKSLGTIHERSITQGWSLQASTCPANALSCGNGACCPSSTFCQATGNAEVAACCSTSSNCRGAVEGNPTCADSSWSLWKGKDGNGFCCDVSLVGAYYGTGSTAGTCAASVPAGATSAILATRGTAIGTTSQPPTTSTTASTRTTSLGSSVTTTLKSSSTTLATSTKVTSTTTTSGAGGPTGTAGKPVFMHYMIGTIYDDHCLKDIQDAQKLGITAFALNIDSLASWATTTTNQLFDHADALGFSLFFSFDMSTGTFNSPQDFQDFLKPYLGRQSYYKYNNVPLVSTFSGESVSTDQWNAFRSYINTPVLIVPGFYKTDGNAAPSTTFFNSNPGLDGIFNWNSWPTTGQGKIPVQTTDDQTFQAAAKSAGKLFMMGLSPLQFKHISSQNWYRRGEANLENRFAQVLQLQPDMLEMQTWNDAGESHYMGNSWNEPINGTTIPYYSDGFDHTGYQQILASFIQAWTHGYTTTGAMYPTSGTVQGTFWHHPLLVNADCSQDTINKKPDEITSIAEDLVTGVVLVKQGQTGLTVVATSGSTSLGTKALNPGFNSFVFNGLTTGIVKVQVMNGNSVVAAGTGPVPVSNTAIKSPLHPEGPYQCNYNFQVVGLSSSG